MSSHENEFFEGLMDSEDGQDVLDSLAAAYEDAPGFQQVVERTLGKALSEALAGLLVLSPKNDTARLTYLRALRAMTGAKSDAQAIRRYRAMHRRTNPAPQRYGKSLKDVTEQYLDVLASIISHESN